MLRSRLVSFCAVASFLLAAPLLRAQESAVSLQPTSPRIVQPIDESKLVALPGGVPPLASARFDRGQAPVSTQMTFVRLVLSRSPQQEAALEKLMTEQLDPSSPNYHKWLTPEQFGKLYGPADSDIETLVTWLQSRGFTVYPVAPGGVSVAFSGSVGQIQDAFHTEIHAFNNNGEQFLSNTSSPRIPFALASVISGIAHLNTIRPRPHHVQGSMGTFDSQQKRLARAGNTSSAPAPLLTTGNGTVSDPYNLYVVPGDAATIYDTPNSFNANYSSGTSYTGTGVTIGIGGDSPIQGSTVADYRNRFLGNSTPPTITNVASDPAISTNDQDEAYIDNELSGGLAPGATIHFYTASNLDNAIEQAISDNTVDIFSLSFGECEAGLSTADNQLISSWWQQAAGQGIAVTVSSGDSGSASCDNDNTEETAEYGLQVSGFASTPYNIAVGGSDYAGLLSSFTTYVNTTSSSGDFFRSALSYIQESTWNDSTETDTTISANVPYLNSGKTNIVGGGGGASSCSTNTNTNATLANCTSGYPKPSWQRGTGVPNDKARDLPDLSLLAGNGFDYASWLVCTDDTGTVNGVTVTANCTTQTDGNFYFFGYGGTSTSAPAFAGMLALVQQMSGSRLGLAAQNLYDIYNGSHASAVFHDITIGNNSVPCTTGTPNCGKNTAGNYFLTGYNTTSGYDLATGLGSVDVTQLIKYWNSSIGTTAATVTVNPASTSITTTQSLSVPVTVSGASGTPTGTLQLKAGSYTSSSESLSGGSYTFTVPAGSLSPSSNTITATYSGDSTYASSTGSATVTVTKATPTVSVKPSITSVGGADASVNVVVTLNGGSITPTGTVTLTATGGYSSGVCTLASGVCTITVPSSSLPNGTVTLTASYSGDSSFNSISGSASITVHIYTATIAVTLPSNVTTSTALQIPITVTGVSGQPVPTGSVSVNGLVTDYQSAANLSNGAATFSFAPGSFNSGKLTLNFGYGGDSYYKQATSTSTLNVAKSSASVTVVPASTSIYTNASLKVTGTVTGGAAGTPSGSVTLSGGGYTSSAISLTNGAYSFTIPANSLSAGTDTLTATYSGDNNYGSSTSTASVTVTQYTIPTPTVTVTLASTSIDTGQSLAVTVNVAGVAGVATPTGTVTLSSGSYTSSATSLSSGSASITIPANSLSAGSDTLSVSYSGDANYAKATATASVTVTTSSYSLSGTTPSAINAGASASSTITVSTSTNYSGSVALTCAVTTSPTGAVDTPTCSITGSPITLSSSATSATATVNFSTTAASAVRSGSGIASLVKSGAATLLALLVFFGIPARRRAWRAILGMLLLIAALGTLSACGGANGGGGGGGGGGNSNPGTTAGTYTFTVTGTGTPSATQTTTVTLTVN